MNNNDQKQNEQEYMKQYMKPLEPLAYLIELIESRNKVRELPEYNEWKGTPTINAMAKYDKLQDWILKEVDRLYSSGELQEYSDALAELNMRVSNSLR